MLPSEMQLNSSVSGKMVVVFFGMTASGKSTLAKVWAEVYQAAYHNTDRIRKELAGMKPSDKGANQVAQGIYSAAFTAKTYEAMLDCARQDFVHGYDIVVLDGSYSKQRDRNQVKRLTEEVGAGVVFIFCTCSDGEVRRRLELRAKDTEAVSDGSWEVYLHQKNNFEIPDASEEYQCFRLNTEEAIGTLLARLAEHPLLQRDARR